MSLTVTVLGCSGSYAGPDNACSGYLLRSPEATVVVDLGAGTLANLQRHVSLDQVDAVVLSHHHPDHWLDLPIMRNALRYYLDVDGLPVYGTAGVHVAAQALIQPFEPTLLWTTVATGSTVQLGDQLFRFFVTDHSVETLAMRIEVRDRTLTYSADTGSAWSAADEAAAGADLFLCEATMPESHEDQAPHLSGRQAGAMAQSAGAARLLLTHFPPGADPETRRAAAATTFAGPIDLAAVGTTFAV
jgi:ribonuclease BN (tRNA processing enzyme)